jgi:hypothetical protein
METEMTTNIDSTTPAGDGEATPSWTGFSQQAGSEKAASNPCATGFSHTRDRSPKNYNPADEKILSPEKSLPKDRECDYQRRKAECQEDVARVRAGQMGRTALRKKYKDEEGNHRNMLSRAGRENVDPRWHDFVNYLEDLGPRPARLHSPDRLHNPDRRYAPGKVEWRDKRAQAANRGNSITLRDGDEELPLTTWARITRQKPDTLRARRDRGWPDEWVIYGEGGRGGKGDQPSHASPVKLLWPCPDKQAAEERFQRYGGKSNRLWWLHQDVLLHMRQMERRLEWLYGIGVGMFHEEGEFPEPPAAHAVEIADLWERYWGAQRCMITCGDLKAREIRREPIPDAAFWLGTRERHRSDQRRKDYRARWPAGHDDDDVDHDDYDTDHDKAGTRAAEEAEAAQEANEYEEVDLAPKAQPRGRQIDLGPAPDFENNEAPDPDMTPTPLFPRRQRNT